MELNVSPDISSLKDEISLLSNRLSGHERQLRSLSLTAQADPPSSVSDIHNIFKDHSKSSSEIIIPSSPAVDMLPTTSLISHEPHSPSRPNIPPGGPSSTSLSPQPTTLLSHGRSTPPNQPSPPPHSSHPHINWVPNESLQSTSFYVGKCHTLTSVEMIRAFVSTELQIPISSIRCRKLTSPSRPLSDYSFISFKVDLPSAFAKNALSHSWPPNTQFTLFQNKRRPPRWRETASSSPPLPKNVNLPPNLSAT